MTLSEKKTREELENLIDKAIKKVDAVKENDLCRFIPGSEGGYIHHFTLKKLKQRDPAQLFELLRKFIVENENPSQFSPKTRAPRGSRKQNDFVNFTKTDVEKILELARKAGDTDLIARFSSHKPLSALKKELIRSIKANLIHTDLWTSYAKAIHAME